MAATFDFETISEASGVVTRRLTIQPDTSVVAPFYAAVQFSLGYEREVVTITERSLLPDSSGVSPIMNPSTVEGLAQTSELRAAAISNVGFKATDLLFELVYSHDAGLDPTFVLSGLMIDETVLIPGAVQFSADTVDTIEVPAPADNAVVSTVLGSAGSQYLYWFTNDRVGVSTESVAAGGQIATDSILDLRMTANTFLSAQTLVDSGVTGLQFGQQNGDYELTLTFQSGAQSVLSFATDTGLLTGSVDTPANEVPSGDIPDEGDDDTPGSDSIEDGVNTGTGITDSEGIEVQAAEIESLLPSADTAFVAYRQRLGDAVALEATKRDGSVVGKIIGDTDARFVGSISNGSTELTVDLPVGTTLGLLGRAGNSSNTLATQYLNGLVDSNVPATNAASAAWNGSLKQAVFKAANQLSGEQFKLDVVTPTRTGSGSEEIAVSYTGSGPAMSALNLGAVDDLVTVSGYESLIAVGEGRLGVAGSSGASVHGDLYGQTITGGRGADFLSGGGGLDTLIGGAGADTFELGFSGITTLGDLSPEDTITFDLFGVDSLAQLNARIQSVAPTDAGLRVQFDTFAVDLIGYSDTSQIQSELVF